MYLKKIIKKPLNINISVTDLGYKISGNLGFVFLVFRGEITSLNTNFIIIKSINKKYLNLNCKLIKQNFRGVSVGFKKKLRLKGLGYTAEILNDSVLSLKLGFSHKINIGIPEDIKIKIKKRKILYFLGFNFNQITNFIAYIRSYKRPDCYKGKGILYYKEFIKLKPGKKN